MQRRVSPLGGLSGSSFNFVSFRQPARAAIALPSRSPVVFCGQRMTLCPDAALTQYRIRLRHSERQRRANFDRLTAPKAQRGVSGYITKPRHESTTSDCQHLLVRWPAGRPKTTALPGNHHQTGSGRAWSLVALSLTP